MMLWLQERPENTLKYNIRSYRHIFTNKQHMDTQRENKQINREIDKQVSRQKSVKAVKHTLINAHTFISSLYLLTLRQVDDKYQSNFFRWSSTSFNDIDARKLNCTLMNIAHYKRRNGLAITVVYLIRILLCNYSFCQIACHCSVSCHFFMSG